MAGLRVGVVCFPVLGGSGVIALALAAGLAERGHQVHVIASAVPNGLDCKSGQLWFHQVQVSSYPVFEYPPYTVALASTIVDVARQHGLDVLHAHYAVPHATCAYLAQQVLEPMAPRIVTSLHGTDVLRFGILPDYLSVTRFAVAQSDGVVVPSVFLKDEARRLFSLPERLTVEVMPNFVDTDRFAPRATRDTALLEQLFGGGNEHWGPLLFHVSTFRPVKRVVDVIEVLERVRRKIPARLVLVGDGPERARVETRVCALGLEGAVRFLGACRDFVSYLQQADAFLLPSETESFGVAALEALSAGVPVFGYNVGGLPELVTQDVGRLVEPFNVEALACAVLEILGDPARHAAQREAARRRVLEHYRAGPAVERYEVYLWDMLSRAPGSGQR